MPVFPSSASTALSSDVMYSLFVRIRPDEFHRRLHLRQHAARRELPFTHVLCGLSQRHPRKILLIRLPEIDRYLFHFGHGSSVYRRRPSSASSSAAKSLSITAATPRGVYRPGSRLPGYLRLRTLSRSSDPKAVSPPRSPQSSAAAAMRLLLL